MGHLELDELNRRLQQAAEQMPVGSRYVHYKGEDKTYTVTGLVIIEATDEIGVVYRPDYDERLSFLRPLAEWNDQVEWQGKTVPRFKLISS